MEIAIVTQTAPRHWRDEDDATLATALDVLEQRADAERRAMRKGRRHG